jgi:hypothetical protein
MSCFPRRLPRCLLLAALHCLTLNAVVASNAASAATSETTMLADCQLGGAGAAVDARLGANYRGETRAPLIAALDDSRTPAAYVLDDALDEALDDAQPLPTHMREHTQAPLAYALAYALALATPAVDAVDGAEVAILPMRLSDHREQPLVATRPPPAPHNLWSQLVRGLRRDLPDTQGLGHGPWFVQFRLARHTPGYRGSIPLAHHAFGALTVGTEF